MMIHDVCIIYVLQVHQCLNMDLDRWHFHIWKRSIYICDRFIWISRGAAGSRKVFVYNQNRKRWTDPPESASSAQTPEVWSGKWVKRKEKKKHTHHHHHSFTERIKVGISICTDFHSFTPISDAIVNLIILLWETVSLQLFPHLEICMKSVGQRRRDFNVYREAIISPCYLSIDAMVLGGLWRYCLNCSSKAWPMVLMTLWAKPSEHSRMWQAVADNKIKLLSITSVGVGAKCWFNIIQLF